MEYTSIRYRSDDIESVTMERKSSDDKLSKNPRRKIAGAAVLQPSVTASLHRALFEEWAESGYASLRMERIAARAGVGKASLYRRWKTKRDMAYEAVETTALTITPVPDTGTLAGDVHAITRAFAVVLRHRLVRRILPDLHAERARSDELDVLLDKVTKGRRAQATVVLERAIERGDISAGVDRQLALDMLLAPLYWSTIVQRRHLRTAEIKRIAELALLSIRHVPC